MNWRAGSIPTRSGSGCRDDVIRGRVDPSFGDASSRSSVSANRRSGTVR